MISLGEFLRNARLRSDLKQVDVEKLTGINHKTLSNWENNVSKPSAEDLITLSKTYTTTVGTLVGTEKAHSRRTIDLYQLAETKHAPVIGTVRCGAGGLAYEYIDEYITIDDTYRPDEMRGFRAIGDSMEPEIHDGDICLVHLQEEAPDGALVVVVICDSGEDCEGTVKRIHKADGTIILQATNPAYPPRVFTGASANNVRIVGRVVEVRHKV